MDEGGGELGALLVAEREGLDLLAEAVGQAEAFGPGPGGGAGGGGGQAV